MIGKKVINSEPIPSIKVKEILDDYCEKCSDDGLNYEQNITLNHLSRRPHYSAEDSDAIIEELEELGVRTKVAVRIVDLIPTDLSDLRLIFAKEPTSLKKEDMEDILKILEKYPTSDEE